MLSSPTNKLHFVGPHLITEILYFNCILCVLMKEYPTNYADIFLLLPAIKKMKSTVLIKLMPQWHTVCNAINRVPFWNYIDT